MKDQGLLHALPDTVTEVEAQTLHKTLINTKGETPADMLTDASGSDGKDTG